MKYKRTVDYLGFMGMEIERLQKSGRFSTADNYSKVMTSFRKWIGCDVLDLHQMTPFLIECYSRFLTSRGLQRNSVSFHMRILRAVYNKACNDNRICADTLFSNVYTGVDVAVKKSVSQEVIRNLFALRLDDEELALSRDLFLFSYFARGMPFVDVAHLRKTSVSQGTIRYWRHKTGQQMYIRIEPCMADIIQRYRDASSPYVFPVLTSLDPFEAYNQYRNALNVQNRNLKRLSKMLGTPLSLSTYSARHSWATSARDRNVPMSVISAALGHTSERTTRIYLSALDNSTVDDANKLVISGIL